MSTQPISFQMNLFFYRAFECNCLQVKSGTGKQAMNYHLYPYSQVVQDVCGYAPRQVAWL